MTGRIANLTLLLLAMLLATLRPVLASNGWVAVQPASRTASESGEERSEGETEGESEKTTDARKTRRVSSSPVPSLAFIAKFLFSVQIPNASRGDAIAASPAGLALRGGLGAPLRI